MADANTQRNQTPKSQTGRSQTGMEGILISGIGISRGIGPLDSIQPLPGRHDADREALLFELIFLIEREDEQLSRLAFDAAG